MILAYIVAVLLALAGLVVLVAGFICGGTQRRPDSPCRCPGCEAERST